MVVLWGGARSPHEKEMTVRRWFMMLGCLIAVVLCHGFLGCFCAFGKKASYYILTLFLFFVFNDIKKKKKEYKEILYRGFWRI